MKLDALHRKILAERATALEAMTLEQVMSEVETSHKAMYASGLAQGSQEYNLAAVYNATVIGEKNRRARQAQAEAEAARPPQLGPDLAAQEQYNQLRERVTALKAKPELESLEAKEVLLLEDAISKFDASERIEADRQQETKNYLEGERQRYNEYHGLK